MWKKFKNYFDLCQKELFNIAMKQNKRLLLFKIKYLYPVPEDSEYLLYNKIILKSVSVDTEALKQQHYTSFRKRKRITTTFLY